MNKDFQKILILGIISIIISAIALYNFRDIKFKNTRKLSQELNNQQEITQEYKDLFDDPNNVSNLETNKNLNTT
jgi:Skp family chaperone for outer membrane proteins